MPAAKKTKACPELSSVAVAKRLAMDYKCTREGRKTGQPRDPLAKIPIQVDRADGWRGTRT